MVNGALASTRKTAGQPATAFCFTRSGEIFGPALRGDVWPGPPELWRRARLILLKQKPPGFAGRFFRLKTQKVLLAIAETA
jgi:hypothetical protein